MKNKNICFFRHSGLKHAGGAERVLVSVANKLSFLGFNIFIMSYKTENKSFYQLNDDITRLFLNYDVEKKRPFSFKFINTLSAIRSNIKSNNIDIIIPLGTEPSILTFLALIFIKYPKKIAWIHYSFFIKLKFRDKVLRKVILPFYDKIIVLNKTDHLKFSNLYPGKVIHIPNPIPFKSSKVSLLNNKTLLALGRLDKVKGFDKLIKIFGLIHRNEKFRDWKLNIFGDDNGEKEYLEKLINKVFINEAKKDVETEYLKSDIYVMTSISECFPMVLLESQEYGLPIVSFDCHSGPRDIICNNINGFIVKVDNIQDFADALMLIMENNSVRNKMGLESKKNTQKFQIDNIIKKWTILLNEL